jgi:hypothetical protein
MKIYSFISISIFLALSCIVTSPGIAGLFDRPDFFEQGRDQFEDEIRRFEKEQSVPNSTLTIDDTALSWSRVVIEEAGFTAMMPSGAITNEEETVVAPKGNINFDIIATHPPASRYVIAYSEELSPERVSDPQEVLERSRDYIVDNKIDLSKIADDNITFEDYPGRQFQLQNKDETIVFRLIVTEQRLYVLAVNQQNDAISPNSIDTFFSSFQLIDRSPQ